MPRDDLLALTDDDLVALSNRGNVKRARRELEQGDLTVKLNEDSQGDVSARWSDAVECRLPADKAPADAQCTCPATVFCRHLVRTVLAYQQTAQSEEAPVSEHAPWDPGTIDDDQLAAVFRKQALSKARGRFDEGMLAELVRSAKPTAHFDEEGCTVRFLVPGDLNYTHCDCDESAPCRHVAMAVWAFRQLPDGEEAGLVSTSLRPLPVPEVLLDDLEGALRRFSQDGVAGMSGVRRDQMRRLQAACTDQGLIWIADILAEVIQQYERYQEHDARFSPVHLAELLGELLIRSDAVRNNTDEIPQLLIRGSRHDRLTAMGQSRLLGMGCGVSVGRGAVELNAYLQDVATGAVVVVGREFADPDDDTEPSPFWRLARTPVVKGSSLAALGTGQLLIQGGRRAANRRFLPGRARAAVHPQSFEWEKLRAPVLADDFQEVHARLAAAPPASLRARRLTEDFHACRVAGVESVRFDPVAQAVETVVRDNSGHTAALWHPYSTRGKLGTEAMLAKLESHSEALRFVAGQVRLRAAELLIRPTCLVFEERSGRTAIQPWIESEHPAERVSNSRAMEDIPDVAPDLVGDYPRQLLEELGELLIRGLREIDASASQRWRELARLGEAAGLTRLAGHVAALADHVEAKLSTPHWEIDAACDALLQVAALAKLASDLA